MKRYVSPFLMLLLVLVGATTGCKDFTEGKEIATVGHAVEACSNYALPHGYGVAIGMMYMCRAAEKLGLAKEACSERLARALACGALPISAEYTPAQLAKYALSDKKRQGDSITLVVPERIGKCVLHKLPVDELEAFIAAGE